LVTILRRNPVFDRLQKHTGAAYPVRCMAARSPVAYRFTARDARHAPNAQPGNLSRKF
jgi:hypothetical protein